MMEEESKYRKERVWPVLWMTLAFLTTVTMSAVGRMMMGYEMPKFSGFLMYFPAIVSLLILLAIEFLHERRLKMKWEEIKSRWLLHRDRRVLFVMLFLTVTSIVNEVLVQSAIPFLSPSVTTFLAQLSGPLTWFLVPLIIERPYKMLQWNSFGLIIVGICFGGLQPLIKGLKKHDDPSNDDQSDSLFWGIGMMLSVIPLSLDFIFQEVAFDTMKGPTIIVLFYRNMISLVVYFFWTFISMIGVLGICEKSNSTSYSDCSSPRPCSISLFFQEQWEAIVCLFSDSSDSDCCGDDSLLWVVVFSVGFVSSMIFSAMLLQDFGATYFSSVNVLALSLSVAIFCIEPLVGTLVEAFEWWMAISWILIAVGVIFLIPLSKSKKYRVEPKVCWKRFAGLKEKEVVGAHDEITNFYNQQLSYHHGRSQDSFFS